MDDCQNAKLSKSVWLVFDFTRNVVIGAVAVVLLLSLINLRRGGSGNISQKLRRLRVLLQFIAIVIMMFTVWMTANNRERMQGT